jgi:hypothetical protein
MPKEKKVQSVSEAGQSKPKFDFSNVNLATGEGLSLEFDSWEELEEEGRAFIEECKKQGVPI